jgi:prephenate dehydrogenase
MNISKLAIIGPGLLGGSVALAVRQRLPEAKIALWTRREEAIAPIQDRQLSDIVSTNLATVVEGAEFVVLCTPVGAMPELARRLKPLLQPSAIVTDVGSVKGPIVAELTKIFSGLARFIGSHPMAGSEQSGLKAARADLFQGAACIVTPDDASEPHAVETVTQFWSLLGCRVSKLSPAEHDAAVAFISHLPHLTAAALVNLVADQNPAAFELCGNGFRDSTRIAAGPAEMWTEIVRSNREPVREALDAMIEKLRELVTLLDANDPKEMTRFLSSAEQHRKSLRP